MKKVFLGLVFIWLFMLPLNATNESDSNRDGYFWEKGNASFKLGYIMGLSDGIGMCNGEFKFYIKGFASDPDSIFDLNVEECRFILLAYEDFLSRYSGYKLTFGQMLDGINEFYDNYRNKTIPIVELPKVIRMEVEGKSKAEVDSVIQELRKVYSK